MPSNGKPYTLYRRKRIYYCRLKLPNGRWSTAKSTGETSRPKAERWAFEYLSVGKVAFRENVTLAQYSKDFFSWEGSWATDKRVRGLRISPHHCLQLTRVLDGHIIPYMGNMRLTRIDRAVIREFRNDLFNRDYSGNTINKILSALKIILESAEEHSLVQFVPKIDRAAMNPKHKGILTIDEVRRLFSINWVSDPVHCHPSRDQFMGYVGNLFASCTGLRMGELQALTLSDIHLDEGYVHVRRSWDKLFGMNETTKTGRARNIIIPGGVRDQLQRLIDINPDPEDMNSFLFFSEKTQGKPVEARVFIRSLYTAMRSIGISEEERRERNVTFHSWRHWFNSLLINARVPIHKIQSLTGHLTDRMTEHYYHPDDMGDVVQVVQDSIFKKIDEENTV